MNISKFEDRRKEKTNNYLVAFQLVFHCVVIIWYLQFESANYASMEAFYSLLIVSVLGVLTLVTLGKIRPYGDMKDLIIEALIITVYILTVFFLVYLTNSFVSRTLFFIPMVIVLIRYGKRIGLIVTTLTLTVFLIIEQLLYAHYNNLDEVFILSLISFLLIWLIGNLMETEEEMRRSLIEFAQRDKYLLENIDSGIIYIDNNDIIRIFNSSAEKLLDISKNSALDKGISSLSICLLEDTPSSFTNNFKKMSGSPEEGTFIRDNKLVTVSRTIDNEGSYLGKVIMIKDLTQTNILHTLEQKVDFITESISMPLLTFNEKGDLTFLNKEASNFFSLDKNRYLFKNYRELFDEDLCNYIKKILDSPKNTLNDEIKLQGIGSKPKELFISTGVFKGILGNVQSISLLIGDVTDIKQRDRHIMQADKLAAIGEMAAGMAHEIRNPLTTIRGMAKLLQRKVQSDSLINNLEIIMEEATRANSILSDFLIYARPSEPEFIEKPLREVFNEICSLIKPNCELKGAEVDLVYKQNENPIVSWDNKQLKQVFLNLALNALKAMESTLEKKLEISITIGDGLIEIGFKDNGEGMEDKILPDVFNPFFTTNDEGTGLGLSVCYRIIENHKGKITLESIKGLGTTFTIQLPIKPN